MMRDGVRRYMVESRTDYTGFFDTYMCAYVYAESEEDAIQLYKDWLMCNGCDPDEVEKMEFIAKEYDRI